MFQNYSEEARKILNNAKLEMKELKHPYVGSEHLLLSILKNKNSISNKLNKNNITYDQVKDKIIDMIGIGSKESEYYLHTPMLKSILNTASLIAEQYHADVNIEHLFMAMLEEGDGIAIRILVSLNCDIDELYQSFLLKLPKKNKKKLVLDELGICMTDQALKSPFDPVIGRDEEISKIIEILVRRSKNNPILIGEAGVGKTAIVEELCNRIVNFNVPNKLVGKKIYKLDMSIVVAGTKYRGEFEDKMSKVIKEVESNDDIILFIDEVHTLMGAGGAEGAIDASNILKPALARNKLKLIGATTTYEYKKYISHDKALDRRFQQVTIEEPCNMKDIIMNLCPLYEKYHRVTISNDMIDLILKYSDEYLVNRYNPDKTIDLLDEVCVHTSMKENKKIKEYKGLTNELNNILNSKNKAIIGKDFNTAIKYKDKENEIMNRVNELELEISKIKCNTVTKKDIEDVIQRKLNLPKVIFSNNIKSIGKKLKGEVIGQETAIDKLISIYEINRHVGKPYAILFKGSSGVGKSMLADLFAKEISNHTIKLDGSEYRDITAINRLIGSPMGYVGYDDMNNVFESIKYYPFSVLILENIDLFNRNIVLMFKNILDEGYIKDSKDTVISFKNVVIIMIQREDSNSIGFNDDNKCNLDCELSTLAVDKILFNKLDKGDITKIIDKMIKNNPYYRLSKDEKCEIIKEINYLEKGAKETSFLLKKRVNEKKVSTS